MNQDLEQTEGAGPHSLIACGSGNIGEGVQARVVAMRSSRSSDQRLRSWRWPAKEPGVDDGRCRPADRAPHTTWA